jgi:hypothetical protein
MQHTSAHRLLAAAGCGMTSGSTTAKLATQTQCTHLQLAEELEHALRQRLVAQLGAQREDALQRQLADVRVGVAKARRQVREDLLLHHRGGQVRAVLVDGLQQVAPQRAVAGGKELGYTGHHALLELLRIHGLADEQQRGDRGGGCATWGGREQVAASAWHVTVCDSRVVDCTSGWMQC